ncbi:PAS domain-containing sensor histidine kinase [candidate division KSB1 bacterium]|nr:PAS domain-containing protein [candidate division KSB1 bacterium]RQW06736.1 MAG: PAS domain-containing sensor histidine kinase [candidate division KSB1 bacterium]
MQKLLREILVTHSDAIVTHWAERVQKIAPTWDKLQVRRFVQDLTTALTIFLLDNKLQASLRAIETIIRSYFQSSSEGAQTIINALLVNRYILLSEMTQQQDSAINSLETFGMLNDMFNPLVVAIFNKYLPSRQINQLPQEFAPSCISNLQSLQFAGVGFFILDRDINIIYWNGGMERIYEVRARDVIGQNLFQRYPNWRRQHNMAEAIEMAMRHGHEKEFYSIKQRVDKQKLILNIKLVPLRDNENKIVACSVLVHDVTEQKSRESALLRYEQYFENILNDAADAIILLNENDRITLWNKAAETLFGYAEDELFGKTLTRITPDHPRAQEELSRMDQIVRDKNFIRNHRMTLMTKSGRSIVVEMTRTALRNHRNDFIGSSVILRDITRQEQLRQQVFQSEKLSAVGTLAAGIAHEVGSPLTSISSLAQILQMKTDSQEFKEKLGVIQQSIERISRTVRTLVDFSRPVAEKVENIYLNNVIEHVIRIIKYDKRLKHQEIVTSLAPNIGMVRASFDQILQVFINICLNAADAMEGQKDGLLQVKTWSENKWVHASISDNGVGIPANNLDHIFEPFFTTKKSGKGTGLGLWVSYNIIKSFSGDIKVESVEGEGTVFLISLPKVMT